MRLSACLSAIAISVPAYADEFSVPSSVTDVTVFPRGASVTRSTDFEVPEGRHTILLEGLLGGGLNENSLRASGSGSSGFSIISVEVRRPDQEALARRMLSARQKWEQTRERLEDQKRGAENAKEAAARQLAFIDASIEAAAASGTADRPAPTAGDWSALWRDSARASQEALAAQQRADQLIRNVDRQLKQLPPPTSTGEQDIAVAVEIEAAGPVDGTLQLEYFHNAASWYPVYDARLSSDEGNALTLQRRAAVNQNTQEDWSNVALTLSTARPTGRTAAIEPRSRRVRLRPEVAGGYDRTGNFVGPVLSSAVQSEASEALVFDGQQVRTVLRDGRFAAGADAEQKQSIAAQQAVAEIQQLGETVIYKIGSRADVPSGTRSRRILIGNSKLNADLQLRATPSADKTAYLYAAFKNDGALILPGEASLIKDDVFIGRAKIKSIAPGETGAIPFGPVETVKLAYRVTERKDADSFGRPEQTFRFRSETRIENLGDAARTLRVYEAMPLTEDEDVEVKLLSDRTPTEIDSGDVTGRLVWEFDLAAGEEEQLSFGYDINWPIGRELIGR